MPRRILTLRRRRRRPQVLPKLMERLFAANAVAVDAEWRRILDHKLFKVRRRESPADAFLGSRSTTPRLRLRMAVFPSLAASAARDPLLAEAGRVPTLVSVFTWGLFRPLCSATRRAPPATTAPPWSTSWISSWSATTPSTARRPSTPT